MGQRLLLIPRRVYGYQVSVSPILGMIPTFCYFMELKKGIFATEGAWVGLMVSVRAIKTHLQGVGISSADYFH